MSISRRSIPLGPWPALRRRRGFSRDDRHRGRHGKTTTHARLQDLTPICRGYNLTAGLQDLTSLL